MLDSRLMFKPKLLEEDVLKALHINNDELKTLLFRGEFFRYKMGTTYEYMFGEIRDYINREKYK